MKKIGNLKIEYIPIGDLKPADYNPRRISDEEMDRLKESIQRFGLVDPIVANGAKSRKNIVIGGHMRLKAAVALGFAEMPVVYVDIPDVAREKELNIRLNRNQGEFDSKLLASFDESLLKLVGFSNAELDRIYDSTAEDDFNGEEEAEKIRKPAAQRGQIYQLGDHVLMCGDSTSPEDVGRLMGGQRRIWFSAIRRTTSPSKASRGRL